MNYHKNSKMEKFNPTLKRAAALLAIVATTSVNAFAQDEATATQYEINVVQPEYGGSISVSPSSASKGDTVTVTFTPYEGYELLTYNISRSDQPNASTCENNYLPGDRHTLDAENKFVMNEWPVRVTGLFVRTGLGLGENLIVNGQAYNTDTWVLGDDATCSEDCFKFGGVESYVEQTFNLPAVTENRLKFLFSSDISMTWRNNRDAHDGFIKATVTFYDADNEQVDTSITLVDLHYSDAPNGGRPWEIHSATGDIPYGSAKAKIRFEGKDDCNWGGYFGPWIDNIHFHAMEPTEATIKSVEAPEVATVGSQYTVAAEVFFPDQVEGQVVAKLMLDGKPTADSLIYENGIAGKGAMRYEFSFAPSDSGTITGEFVLETSDMLLKSETFDIVCKLPPFTLETDSETGKQVAEVKDDKGFFGLFGHLNTDTAAVKSETEISFGEIITRTDTVILNADSLTIEQAKSLFPTLEPVTKLTNKLMAGGSLIKGLVFNNAGGLAEEIAENGGIYDMVMDSATAIVDLQDESKYLVRNDTVYIPLVAKVNNGVIENFGFAGDVLIDEESIPAGKEIAICLTLEMSEGSVLTGFMFLGDVFAVGDNDTKRCITLKQNLGCAVPPPGKSTTKVATSKASGNKSVDMDEFNYSEAELNQNSRAFTEREFASGVVAYWLNYSGPGYTGEYQDKWSQGIAYPVVATKNADGEYNTVQKVIYEFKGDNSALTAAPLFVNNGETMTVKYDSKPKSITCGETAVELGETSATFTYRKGETVLVDYSEKEPDGIADIKSSPTSVSINGKSITVNGAATVRLLDMAGRTVAQSANGNVEAPTSGIYAVCANGQTWKVMIK